MRKGNAAVLYSQNTMRIEVAEDKCNLVNFVED